MFAHAVMRALRKNKTLRYGVPMLLLIVGGSFGLREFSQIRYDAVKIKIDPELEEKLKMNKVSLESEYEPPSLQQFPHYMAAPIKSLCRHPDQPHSESSESSQQEIVTSTLLPKASQSKILLQQLVLFTTSGRSKPFKSCFLFIKKCISHW
ncbi:cytochrome c oxidase assembly protein COX16 homolog, mitochondrial [Physeter macrocephalus]|uniref:Cytochrome c oxidase assembly protein COX16 homolog, mitochondrial n=1 Tax=Physeter macrocephalus TaxID=9755 RepID=A0A9W2WZI5_PHYMC|nr:uncharacterized protein LOC102974468 [Physeter catodon]